MSRYNFQLLIRVKALILGLMVSTSIYCQRETIEVIKLTDIGDIHPDLTVCFAPLEGGFKFASQDIGLNFRLYGFYEFKKEKFGIHFNLGQGVYNSNSAILLNNQSGYNLSREVDLSFYYLFKKLQSNKKTTVRVNSNYFMNTFTYFNDTAKWSVFKGVKMGFTSVSADMFIDGGIKTRFFPYIPSRSYDLNIAVNGISFGYYRRSYTHLVVEEVENKKKHSAIGGGIFYADVMAFPFNRFVDRELQTDLKDSVKAIGRIFPFGFRVGFKSFNGSIKPLEREAFTVEAGYLPYHGITLSIGIGLCVINKHPNGKIENKL